MTKLINIEYLDILIYSKIIYNFPAAQQLYAKQYPERNVSNPERKFSLSMNWSKIWVSYCNTGCRNHYLASGCSSCDVALVLRIFKELLWPI